MKRIVLLLYILIINFFIFSQNDPKKLSEAYRELKNMYLDFDNHSVPFKVNNKWGLLSNYGVILHEATLDSIFKFSKNMLIGKEDNNFKLIDCNGNIIFNKTFKNLKINSSHSLEAIDENNSFCEVSFTGRKDFYLNLDINPRKILLTNDESRSTYYIDKDVVVDYYNIDPINNHYIYFYSDSTHSKIEIYKNGKLYNSVSYNGTGESFDIDRKMLTMEFEDGRSHCLIYSTNKFISFSDLNYSKHLRIGDKDYFVMMKNDVIDVIDEDDSLIKRIPNIYSNVDTQNNRIILSNYSGKKIFVNTSTWELDTSQFIDITTTTHYIVTEEEESVFRVFDNAFQEIFVDTNVNFYSYLTKDRSFLIVKKHDEWRILDNSGNNLYSITNSKLKDCTTNNGVIKLGYYNDYYRFNPILCGVFTNDSLKLIDAQEIQIINSNCYFINSHNYYFTDSSMTILKKIPNNHNVKIEGIGENFSIYDNFSNDLNKKISYQYTNELKEVIDQEIKTLGVRDLSNRFVKSPFYIYTEKSKEHFYGILDSKKNIVLSNEFRMIYSLNENFIVIDKDYEIGFLNKNGKKLY